MNWKRAAIAFYAGAAIMTFGHSAADLYPRELYNQMVCDEAKAAGMKVLPQTCRDELTPKRRSSFDALIAAAVWPLYWAWEVFE